MIKLQLLKKHENGHPGRPACQVTTVFLELGRVVFLEKDSFKTRQTHLATWNGKRDKQKTQLLMGAL